MIFTLHKQCMATSNRLQAAWWVVSVCYSLMLGIAHQLPWQQCVCVVCMCSLMWDSVHYLTTFIVNHGLLDHDISKRIQIWTDVFKSSFTAERNGCCSTLCFAGVTWMDNELIVSMAAVVRGELVVHRTALMQYACRPETSNLWGHL